MKFTESQLNDAKDTLSKRSLSIDTKNEMLKNIYKSTPNEAPTEIISPWGNYFTFFKQKSFVIAATLILMLTSTTYASAVSLPGDFLYPVKTDFIEPLVLTFKISPESKAKYQEKLAQKRILEQEMLAAVSEKQITNIEATISTTTDDSVEDESKPTSTKKIKVITGNSEVKISITSDQIEASSTISINNISTSTSEHVVETTNNITEDSKEIIETVTNKAADEVKDTMKEVSDTKEEVKETVKDVENSVGSILGL